MSIQNHWQSYFSKIILNLCINFLIYHILAKYRLDSESDFENSIFKIIMFMNISKCLKKNKT
jgi:hypothetical protein